MEFIYSFTNFQLSNILRNIGLATGFSVICGLAQADPLTSNNGFYPTTAEYSGTFIAANLTYPDAAQNARFPAGGGTGGGLTVETAEDYMMALKEFITPSFSTLFNDPGNWKPADARWYDLVWSGNSDQHPTDPTSGRESLMNSYTGQIIHATSFAPDHRPTSK